MRFRGVGKAGGGASCWGEGFGVIWEKGTGPRASREPEGRSVLRRRLQLMSEYSVLVLTEGSGAVRRDGGVSVGGPRRN